MGLMKEYLIEKTSELAGILGIPGQDFYQDQNLSNLALAYAQYLFHKGQEEKNTREEIRTAILTRTDEVVELIQEMLDKVCEYDAYLEEYAPKAEMCAACEFSFLCEASTQYK